MLQTSKIKDYLQKVDEFLTNSIDVVISGIGFIFETLIEAAIDAYNS